MIASRSIVGAAGRLLARVLPVAGVLAIGCSGTPEVEVDPGSGLVVERVRADGAAADAGLQVGDRLLLWQAMREGASPATHPFRSPFDIQFVESEESVRGPVRLVFERDGSRRTTRIGYRWRLTARPVFPAELEAAYDEALAQSEADPTGSVTALEALADGSEFDIWLLYRAALIRREADLRDGLGDAYRAAVTAARARGDERSAAVLLFLAGYGERAVGHWLEAGALFEEAAEAFGALGSELMQAAALDEQGEAWIRTGRRDEGTERIREGLEIRQRLAPDSLAVAASWTSLSNLAPSAEERRRTIELALDINSRRAAGSIHHLESLNNLGNALWALGDLDGATEHLRASEALILEKGLGGRRLAMVRGNLALVARARGDLGQAERSLLETLEYFETHEPTSPMTAETYSILGSLRRSLGDLEGARDMLQRALALWKERRPGGEGEIGALKNLGDVAHREGDLARAREQLQAALRLAEAQGMTSDWAAAIQVSLGNVERKAGRFDLGSQYLERALATYREHRPGSQQLAATEGAFAQLLREQDRLDEAAAAYRRALGLGETLAPGSMMVARPLHGLAQVAEEQGRVDEALALYARAVEVFEVQVGRAADSQIGRAQYRSEHRSIVQDFIALLIRQGLLERAFAVLEQSRAQSFLAMLAERRVDLMSEVPAELVAERRELDARYDALQAQRLRGTQASVADPLGDDLEEVRRDRELVHQKMRTASPRLASLSVPETVGVARAQEALEAGSVLLSFNVGDDSTQLLTLTSGTLRAIEIPVGHDQLARRVTALRLLLSAGASGAADPAGVSETRSHLQERAEELYDLLIRPAAAEIETASQLLIVPDGPLHVLPFAALRNRADDSYLMQNHAIRFAHSLSTDLQLRSRGGRRQGNRSIVAFADPYTGAVTQEGTDRDALRRRATLGPLPGARREVESLHRVFDEAQTYVGREASEERVKELGGSFPYLHFATHAVVSEREPLDAGLILSLPETRGAKENGFLQAWEIFEQLRIDAELVVLSACETGIGADLGADGILGLTRAFQFAGARSVLASLWQVADRSTAPLMVAFYEELDAGHSAADALRAAQLRLLRGDAPSLERPGLLAKLLGQGDAPPQRLDHPYHWAGFQLYGDSARSSGSP